jgi:hypothetical protein
MRIILGIILLIPFILLVIAMLNTTDEGRKKAYKEKYGKEWKRPKTNFASWPLNMWND